MDIRFDLDGFRTQIQAKQEAIAKATRPAAQAGAQVIYEAARLNAPASGKTHYFYIRGKKYGPYAPGNLRDAIYQVYSKDHSGGNKAEYQVSWNFKKAPYGFIAHKKQPFMVIALHDYAEPALQAMKQRFLQEMKA